nr:hypothetical protein RKHAN_01867 [Rhizobium sp. Khangiran2]
MKNFISTGDIITVTAPANVSSGDLVIVGTLAGVAVTDAASGAPVEIMTAGVFELAKTSAQAWTVGAAIYATSAGVATTVSTDNTLVGKAVAVAANPSATGIVWLNG